MDNDKQMLKEMGDALTNLQIKYREADLATRMTLKPSLDELTRDVNNYQLRLLKEGVISTGEDLKEMTKIKKAVDEAASKQQLAEAIARTIEFVAGRA